MTQYLAHIIMYPYLVLGGYDFTVNDIDKCHRYIDAPATTMVLHEQTDPRLVLYGVSLTEFAKYEAVEKRKENDTEHRSGCETTRDGTKMPRPQRPTH